MKRYQVYKKEDKLPAVIEAMLTVGIF